MESPAVINVLLTMAMTSSRPTPMTSCGHNIRHTDTFSTFLPATFQLMCRNSSTPEKSIFKS
ncbi:MAG: hypothetical protein ACFN4A_11270, partial [Streptococcus mutans]